ncbi:mediator complex, subunit MED19 [Lophium mytilinum]|uniref:Mediator of RNA polymerase II transcription subunit 19 n=1 Tax=Lophium mytilinum TaxID=390894 RepID=A0A6A6QVV0_9PEZI|nr:mediator complex, subunit MED19 [Lophium mytilinum]
MGSLFKLCQTPHPISRPHASQNLVTLYGLNDIATSVQRIKPGTANEKNTLRKTYLGHVKNLQLAGKNKPYNNPNEDFRDLLSWPVEEWHNQKEHGKRISDGLGDEVLDLLDRALQMAPGKLPHEQAEKWKGIVAPDETVKPKSIADMPGKRPLQPAPAGRNPAAMSPGLKSARPERSGVKRRYNETSFVGYGEGYADDDVADSTGGEDDGRGSSKKKRRKEFSAASPLGMNDRGMSGMGMIGSRR